MTFAPARAFVEKKRRVYVGEFHGAVRQETPKSTPLRDVVYDDDAHEATSISEMKGNVVRTRSAC